MGAAITNQIAQDQLTVLKTAIDAGTGAIIQIRTGAAPGPDNAATGTLLAELAMSATAFGAVTDANPHAQMVAAAITDDAAADATGTAGHWRILTQAAGAAVMEGTCGIAASGADMIFDSVDITAGSRVSITSFTITQREI